MRNDFPVSIACDCQCELAEGPVWHNDSLYWVDIVLGDIYRMHAGSVTRRRAGGLLGAAVPTDTGQWLVARDDGFSFFNWDTGEIKHLHDPESHLTGNRFNDGKCDPQGRFWAGTMNLEGAMEMGGLHVLDASLVSRSALDRVSLSNGLGWSPDGQILYYIDTLTRRVDAFAFDGATGSISGRRTFRQFTEADGYPDGMTVDSEGNLWVALWGGSAVVCLQAGDGRELCRIELPVTQPSSCTFGGRDMTTLFITSAWQGLSLAERGAQPAAGNIFQATPGARGFPPALFAAPPS